jgi:SAM-dependent methyltransferase
MPAVSESRIRSAVGLATSPAPLTNQTVTPVTATSVSPSLRCPRCRRALVPVREGELQCTRPSRPHSYPIVAGIPDLRTTRDADIAIARERAEARFLAEKLSRAPVNADGRHEDLSLLTPEGSFAEDYASGSAPALCSPEEVLTDWRLLDRDLPDPRIVLDIGCGSGKLLEEAARRWPVCVGVDGSLRRLVMARHRLQQAGIRARLVCANLDALPFADGMFDRVIAEWVLELSPRKERALREWNRMLGAQGRLWISTSNRWSVRRDPQLGIPALSWLPMQLLDVWAKWHGLTFPERALVGTKRLRALLEESGYSHIRLGQPMAAESPEMPEPRGRSNFGRGTIYDLAVVREIAKRVRPMLVATAEARRRMPSRVRYDRYVARLAL